MMRTHLLPVVMMVALAVLGLQTEARAQGGGGGGGGAGGGTTGAGTGELLGSAGGVEASTVMEGQGEFIGSGSADTEFIGAGASGSTTTTTGRNTGAGGNTRNTTNTNRNTTNRGRQTTNARNTRNTNRANTSNRAVNSRMQIGFAITAPSPEELAEGLAERLANARRITALSDLEVMVQGREATLQGLVATTYDRALAEQMALLEVGIVRVRNELEVAETLVAPESPAPDGETE